MSSSDELDVEENGGGVANVAELSDLEDLDALFAEPIPAASVPVARLGAAPERDGRAGTGAGTAALPSGQSPLLASTQWRVETFQLVNWGGFHGRHVFAFSPGNTLVTGASGTGKSTMLDAYIALMMPSDTPFNGASNDAVSGRARSADQRNLISYLRGKLDATQDDGRDVDKVLRGDKTATWGAVGMTFISDEGQRFTTLRVYYVPASATSAQQITMRLATYDDAIDLSRLEGLVGAGEASMRFAPRALKEAFPGMRTFDSYSTFAQSLHTRLGIGTNGDGEKALRLLVRIQAGHQIRTVDELYKQMVLETPSTFAAADRAIEHFDDLEAAYAAMVTEQQKAELLEPITGLQESLEKARAQIETLDVLGLTENHRRTPLALWELRTRARLLDRAADDNRERRDETRRQLGEAYVLERRTTQALDLAKDAHRDAGGGAIDKLRADIADEETERERRAGRRASLAEATSVLEMPLATRDDFDALAAAADAFRDGFEAAQGGLRDRRDGLLRKQVPLATRKSELLAERASLSGRQGRVPKALDDMRRLVAEASGLDPADLPFVAELIDVAPHEARWRTAIETVLFGSARIMLVPLEKLEEFSRVIDAVRLRGRLSFEGAERGAHRPIEGDPRYIAGKLLYKDSPFSGWVAGHVRARSRNALCVEQPQELAGDDLRVTPSGQTRLGRRGSHGRHESANIIGFSNTDAIAEIDWFLREVEADLTRLDEQLGEVQDEQTALEQRRGAYDVVRHYTWDDIDTQSIDAHLSALNGQLQQLLSMDGRLQELTRQIEDLEDQLDKHKATRHRLEATADELKDEHATLVEEQDRVAGGLEQLEADGDVQLSDADAEMLDAELREAASHPDWLADFDENLVRLQKRLAGTAASAREAVEEATGNVTRVFAQYQARWPDPNLGVTATSYPDYARILEKILETGLYERRTVWRARLATWSGQDLVPLNHALDTAIGEIEDRLRSVNEILATLPFGAGQDRLRIKLRRLTPESVAVFRRELKHLAGAATRELTDEETERRFAELQQFMAKIRKDGDPRLTPELAPIRDRECLLDVRRHVEVKAERYDLDGQLLSTHSSLGGKSGGESQELVAFIVGAALRFRLGDELRARPRFAPVFLDEGFVKADSQFTGRAVQAWQGLGFQLIVGAPLDKVSALEPHMDLMLGITKDKTGRSFVHTLRDSTEASATENA